MRTIKAIVPALAGVSSTVTKEQMIFTRMYFFLFFSFNLLLVHDEIFGVVQGSYGCPYHQ